MIKPQTSRTTWLLIKPQTRDEARQRLKELEVELLSSSGSQRRAIGLQKQVIIAEMARLPQRAPIAAAAPRRAPAPKKDAPPPYVGPRCGYCGGEQPQGEHCRNEGPDWPHPPHSKPKEADHAVT